MQHIHAVQVLHAARHVQQDGEHKILRLEVAAWAAGVHGTPSKPAAARHRSSRLSVHKDFLFDGSS
jgi:hypothetical protein